MMEAKYIIPNEVVRAGRASRDRYGVTMVTVRHFDGRTSVVPRNQLMFDEDERQLRELARIIHNSRNIGKSKRYFELFKELVKREAPIGQLSKFIEEVSEQKVIPIPFQFEVG